MTISETLIKMFEWLQKSSKNINFWNVWNLNIFFCNLISLIKIYSLDKISTKPNSPGFRTTRRRRFIPITGTGCHFFGQTSLDGAQTDSTEPWAVGRGFWFQCKRRRAGHNRSRGPQFFSWRKFDSKRFFSRLLQIY